MKEVNRFKRIAGSLENLVSSIAQDWDESANSVGAAAGDALLDEADKKTQLATRGASKGNGRDTPESLDKPIYFQIRKAQLLFSELHSTARKAHSAIEGSRNKVSVAKQSMDQNHLQLENLLYERDHLSRETQLCRDFTMTELSTMEEDEEQGFLEDVDTLQTTDEHARNLSILKEQKGKRMGAQLELEAVQIRVKAANSAVNESKQYLDKLPDYLKDVEKALVPLRKNMPWRPGTKRGRHEQVADLPLPLFTLYCQLEAYCDSVLTGGMGPEDESAGSSLVVYGGVGGDTPPASVSLAPAKTHVSASAKAAAQGPDDTIDAPAIPAKSPERDGDGAKRQKRDDGGDAGGQGGVNGGGETSRKVSKRGAGRAMLEALKPSPLEVVFSLNGLNVDGSNAKGKGKTSSGKDGGNFAVRFSYLPALGIVVVCPQAGSPPSLLSNLFPDDTGQGTPNPANHHGRAARASALGVFEFPADVQCRPYRWAQWLAGLHFPAPGAAASSAVAGDGGVVSPIEPSTRAVGAALRSRARTHVALAAQMKSFATKGVSSSEDKVPEGMGNVELRSWKELSGADLQQAVKAFGEEKPSSGDDAQEEGAPVSGVPNVRKEERERLGARYFAGVLKTKKGRGKERNIEIQVELPVEYPLRPSLVRLAERGNPAAQEELGTISNEVNDHYDTLLTEDATCWDHLLSNQLCLTMECLIAKPGGGVGRLRTRRMRRNPVLFDRLERTFMHR